MPAYRYETASRRFRDVETGRFVSRRTIDRARDEMLDRSMARVDALTTSMQSGQITRFDWWIAMRAEIKQVRIAEYLLARGGRNAMTQSDWGTIGAEIRRQYQYLDRFFAEISQGTVSESETAARARLYVAGSNASYADGQAATWNNVQFPARPGDGSTQCRQYCRCSWSLVETDDAIEATWRLGGSKETCADCKERANAWAPLRFDKQSGALVEAAA